MAGRLQATPLPRSPALSPERRAGRRFSHMLCHGPHHFSLHYGGWGEPFWASWSPVSGADRNPGTACPLFHVAPGPGPGVCPGPGVSPGQVDPQLLPDPASGSCLRPGWPAPPHAARQTLARVGRGRSWPRTARRPLLPRPAASRPPSLPPSSARPAPEPAELRVAGTGCDPCPGGRSPVLAAESDRI